MACDDFGRDDSPEGGDDVTQGCFVEAMTGELEAVGFRTEAGFDGLDVVGRLWGQPGSDPGLVGHSAFPQDQKWRAVPGRCERTPYRIERALLQLHQAGVLDSQRAIVLGAFTEYRRSPLDRGYTLKTVIHYLRELTQVPILTGLPFGHVPVKLSLPLGRQVNLVVQGVKPSSCGDGVHAAFRKFLVRTVRVIACGVATASIVGCNNSPYAEGASQDNALYTAFNERSPRYLDPTSSYSSNETPFTYQIYEPLYATTISSGPTRWCLKPPKRWFNHYVDKAGKPLPDDAPADQIAESRYTIRIRPGVLFSPHPAFARDAKGDYLYHHLTREQIGPKRSPGSLPKLVRVS